MQRAIVGPIVLTAAVLTACACAGAFAGESEIPSEFLVDPVMAPAAEVEEIQAWAAAAFGVASPAGGSGLRLELQVRRQDHNTLRFGQSCMETPIRIGQVEFRRGLGTHATSEIAVALPETARRFQASVGIDNNDDTQGKRGSAEFEVAAAGTTLVRTRALKGGEAPFPVDVEIPAGSRELALKVHTTEDGAAYDQSDWADARIVLADGSVRYLDENQPDPFLRRALPSAPPFSFLCGGKPSSSIAWVFEAQQKEGVDRVERVATWSDPATGLRVRANVVAFRRYPAIEWMLRLENAGSGDTPVIEKVQVLDLELRTGNSRTAASFLSINGDVCGERTFLPIRSELVPGKPLRLAPTGGRSSNGTFPFFDVEYGSEGVIAAIGWTGQWAATIDRSGVGPTRVQAGMEHFRAVLHPGEAVRTPRVLLMTWKNDRIAAHNRWRRLLLFKYAPQSGGKPFALPIVSQCFDRYSWTRPEWATEAGQIAAARFARDAGFDAHWLDAAWFPGGFPNGVGSWSAKPKEFPNGLAPVGAACRAMGLKFVLWFEPERVAPGSEIAREHPEFVLGGSSGGLFNLGDPAARRWLTELLSKRIAEWGIDIYRNDFNMDPLEHWRRNDAPDRQGITEIRYVEGLYAMWDELRARHPGLLIDNCSSGGRRIDLEMCSRSVPFWRSDTSCSPGHVDWNQAQTCGLGLYVPLHMACGWTPEPYEFRSSATAGAIAQWDYLNPAFPMDLARATLAEAKENRRYWYGDFWPLAESGLAADAWMAYQFHRPDLDAGIVLAFRRPESRYTGLALGLRGIDPSRDYRVELLGERAAGGAAGGREERSRVVSGRELAGDFEVRIPKKGSSMVLRYGPAK